jgi:hypothetical protein
VFGYAAYGIIGVTPVRREELSPICGSACIDDTIYLRPLGSTEGVIFSETFSQKSSNWTAGSASFFEPTIIA